MHVGLFAIIILDIIHNNDKNQLCLIIFYAKDQ